MILKRLMITAFKILNNEGNIVEDLFGQDVYIREDGNAKFKSLTADTITTGTINTTNIAATSLIGTLATKRN